MEIKTDSFTGKPTLARVCSYCEKKHKETEFLHAYLKHLNISPTHGICPDCYQIELDKLKVG